MGQIFGQLIEVIILQKKCLFAALELTRDAARRKFVENVYEIAFNTSGSWSLDNEFARNVVIVDVGNSSPRKP